MHFGKRLLSLLLAFCILFSNVPVGAFATEQEQLVQEETIIELADDAEIILEEPEIEEPEAETPEIEDFEIEEPEIEKPEIEEPEIEEPEAEEPEIEEPVVEEPEIEASEAEEPEIEEPVTEEPVVEETEVQEPETEASATEENVVSETIEVVIEDVLIGEIVQIPVADEAVTEKVNAIVSVNWDTLGHRGKTPDIHEDIRVLTEDGQTVENVTVTFENGVYVIGGLSADGSYIVGIAPDENSGYTVEGESEQTLIWQEEAQHFAAAASFEAIMDRFGVTFQLSLPEGMELPAAFDAHLYYKDEKLDLTAEPLGDGLFFFDGLYKLDGSYTLRMPELEDLKLADGYDYTVSSNTEQLVTVAYEKILPSLELVIYWKDDSDVSGRREQQNLEDLIDLHTAVGDDISKDPLVDLILEEGEQEASELSGYEKYSYTIRNIPYGMDESVELVLKWDADALPGYEGAIFGEEDFAEGFDDTRFVKDVKTGVYASEEAYAFTLPENNLTFRIDGLSDDGWKGFEDGLTITLYDFASDSEIPFGDYWLERSGNSLTVHGLYTTYLSDGAAEMAFYTVTWPQQIGNSYLFEDMETSMVVGGPAVAMFGAEGADDGVVVLGYYDITTDYLPSGKTSESMQVVWYDKTASYAHQGELVLSVEVAIGDGTKTVTPVWNETAQAYVYNWKLQDLKDANLKKKNGNSYSDEELNQILDKLAPLTVKDTGANNLNRTLTAETTGQVDIVTTQFYQEQNREIVAFNVESIAVNEIDYDASTIEDVEKYLIGKSTQNGTEVVTFFPMTYVELNLEFRNGADPIEDSYIQAAFDSVALFNKLGETLTPITSDGLNAAYQFEDDFDIISNMVATGSGADRTFNVLLPLYTINKVQADYTITCDEVHPEGKDYYYRVQYDNTTSPGHGTDVDSGFDKGEVILIRTGDTDFNFHKVWLDEGDDAAIAARPDATYTLWRYSTKSGDYTTAAMMEIPIGVDADGKLIYAENDRGNIPNGKNVTDAEKSRFDVTIANVAGLQLLEQYDAEGYPYVYFIREDYSGSTSEYQKIVGQVTGVDQNGNPIILKNTDLTDYGNPNQVDADRAIYDNGYLTNRKTEKISKSVTKSWIAAYYQDQLENLSVELTLYGKHKDDSFGDTTFTVKTETISGFDAYNSTKTASVTVDKFDGNGHELGFWWEETAIIENGVRRELDNNDNVKLPMNEASIAEGGASADTDEHFHAEVTVGEDGNTTVTNTLKGATEYWVRKTWNHELTKSDVTFVIYQIDESGTIYPYKDEQGNSVNYVLTANSEHYNQDPVTKDGVTTYFASEWHVPEVFDNLPLYDETGNRYSYIVKEQLAPGQDNILPLPNYNKDADGDATREPNSLEIHNGIGESRIIHLRKMWLDDSATTDRATVYFEVYAETGNKKLHGEGGYLSNDPVAVDGDFNWMETVDVTVYTNGTQWSKTKVEEEGWALYDGKLYVKEVRVGDGEAAGIVMTAPDYLTDAGYSTVTYGDTKYAVIYDKNGAQSSEYSNTPDADGFYTVTNLRIGTTKLEVRKIWKDDDTVLRSSFTASMNVDCTDEEGRIVTGTDTYGYAKVHTAVSADGLQPILNNAGNPVKVSQVLDTRGLTNVETGEIRYPDEQTVYYYNLPLYDEAGKILHYEVTEIVSKVNGATVEGGYAISSTGITYDPDSTSALEQVGMQTVTNTYQHTTDVNFYLLWLDQYRVTNQQRPDMYLTLYKTQTDAQGNVTIVPAGYTEYVWDGVNNNKITEDHWQYTFPNMPMYDGNGNKITYYATVTTDINDTQIEYLKAQYAEGQVDHYIDFNGKVDGTEANVNKATVTENNGLYTVTNNDDGRGVVGFSSGTAVMSQDNTFVLQIRNDVTVEGHKVWERVPEGFPAAQLPKLNFLLKRNIPEHKDDLDNAVIRQTELTIAAILNYTSPSTDYEFEMAYIGINVYDPATKTCSSVPADSSITFYNAGTRDSYTLSALQTWMQLAGIMDIMIAEKYYGQPLTKYNQMGDLYDYTMVESYITPGTDSYIHGRVVISNSINEYDIVNTVWSHVRPIEVSKTWLQNGQPVPEDFLYPSLQFRLYRTVKTGENQYMEAETVATKTLTGAQVKAGTKAAFGNQDIFAPNGEPYIYFVGEKTINGYNNDGDSYPVISVADATTVTNENLPVCPDSGYHVSSYFTLDNVYATAQLAAEGNTPTIGEGDLGQNPNNNFVVEVKATVEVSATNNYTALVQVDKSGAKFWNDHENKFGTRPGTLTVDLYRKVSDASQNRTIDEKIATLTLAANGGHAIAWKADKVNMTSAIKNNQVVIENVATTNAFAFMVKNLDKYASNGYEWTYYLKETQVVDGYTVSGEGSMSITNDLNTHVEVIKNWKDEAGNPLNKDLEYPAVKVKLQVRYGANGVWQDAATAFGSNYTGGSELTQELNEERYWRAIFEKLPIGVKTADGYQECEYRVVETQVKLKDGSWVDVTENNGSFFFGSEENRFAVTLTQPTGNSHLHTVDNKVPDTKLTVTKVWKDDNKNAYGTRPADNWTVKYHVYRTTDGTYSGGEQLLLADGVTPVVLEISGGKNDESKSATISDLLAYAPDGRQYTYYAVELDVNGEEVAKKNEGDAYSRYNGGYDVIPEHSVNADGYTSQITNKLIITSVAVTKLWEGEQSNDFRPGNIDLTLKRGTSNLDSKYKTAEGAEPIWTKNQDNTWTATYVELPKYDTSGNAYTYTVEESQQSGFQKPLYVFTAADATVMGEVDGNIHKAQIRNIATEFRMDKVDFDAQATKLNGVTLVFQGTGNVGAFKLTWNRSVEGVESYTITKNNAAWSSGTAAAGEKVDIIGLPEGTYNLTQETVIPDGYYASAINAQFTLGSTVSADKKSVTQTLSENSGHLNTDADTVTLKVTNKKTTLSIEKLGKVGGSAKTVSGGWKFRITGTFANDEAEYLDFVPGAANDFKGKLIVGQEYIMTEIEHPDGFTLSDAQVRFKLKSNNEIELVEADGVASVDASNKNELQFTDSPFQVAMTKYRDHNGSDGKKLGGAVFSLKDSTGAQIGTYTTANSGNNLGNVTINSVVTSGNSYRVIFKTAKSKTDAEEKNAVYTLEEITAPAGYILPDEHPSIRFWFNDKGEMQVIENTAVTRSGNSLSVRDLPIKLTLVKMDGGDRFADPDTLANVTFDIYEGNTKKGSVTTDSTGTINFGPDTADKTDDFLLVGGTTYTLKEVKKNGYTQLADITFKVETNGTITYNGTDITHIAVDTDRKGLDATNDRIPGTVVLSKYTQISGENFFLDGAEFKLYRENDASSIWDKLQNLITGKKYELVWSSDDAENAQIDSKPAVDYEKGKLYITNLPWGSYKLEEVKAPNGYKLVTSQISFTIDAEHIDVTAKLDETGVKNDTFRITVSKHLNVNGIANTSLNGAIFELQTLDGATIKTLDTGTGSQITIDSVEITETNGVKTLNTIMTTGKTESETAHYKLVETKAPDGYILPDAKPFVIFWVDESGEAHECDCANMNFSKDVIQDDNQFKFLDKPIKLKLTKMDGGDLFDDGDVLANVTFDIYVGENKQGSVTTDDKGEIHFGPDTTDDFKVVGGTTYILKEQTVAGFQPMADISFTVNANGTITYNDSDKDHVSAESKDLTITNERKTGEVVLTKITTLDGKNYDLNGAEFTLYREKEARNWIDEILGLVTGKTYEVVWDTENKGLDIDEEHIYDGAVGTLKLTNLPWGNYKLVETKAPEGYVLPAAEADREHPFTISDTQLDATVQIEPVSNDSFRFEFTKHASADGTSVGQLLDEAEFKLHLADSETAIQTYTTVDGKITVVSNGLDEDGKLVTYMKTGKTAESAPHYRITETKAPDGHELPDPAPYVEFWVDELGAFQYVSSSSVANENQFLDKPIELTLVKYDGGDRFTEAMYNFTVGSSFDEFDKLDKLEGISFELTGNDGSRQTSENGELTFGPNGAFQVVGGVTYTLTEQDSTGRGYYTTQPFRFTVNYDGTITMPEDSVPGVTLDQKDDTKLNVVNKRILGKVTLTKTTEEEHLLDNVTFKLYRYDSPDNWLENILDFITGKTYVLAATFDWDAEEVDTDTYSFGKPEQGKLIIDGLDWGTYKLVETIADGYILPEDAAERTYIFNIGPEDKENNVSLDEKIDVMNITNRVMIHKVALGDESRESLPGAQYDLFRITTGENGTVDTKITNTTDPLAPMWIWNSESGVGEASCLPTGDYKLVETRSPYGYVIADPVVFHVDPYGVVTSEDADVGTENTIPVVYAADQLTKFTFTKHELYNESCFSRHDATRILPGVTFIAYEDEELTKPIAEAVSDENGIVTFRGLPLMDYKGANTRTPVYIQESETVSGHVLNDTVFTVYVDSYLNDSGDVVSNSVLEDVKDNIVINDVFRADFGFTKVSELDNTKVIPGAVYGLYKTVTLNAVVAEIPYEIEVARAASDANGNVSFEGLLMDVKYTVKEQSVPAGSYVSKNSVSFRFTWDEEAEKAKLMILDDGKGTITAEEEALLWQEPQVVVSILKVDAHKRPLAGAKLQIRDKDGNVIPVRINGKLVKHWISTKKPVEIAGQLEHGKTYYLHELEAPGGYYLSKPVKFKISDDPVKPGENKVVEVMMKNYRITENPKTADGNDIMLYTLTMSASGLGLLGMLSALLLRRRRRNG